MKNNQCPSCQSEVDMHAQVCSNPACRAALAMCSHCRGITTYVLVEKGEGRLGRDVFRCDRCGSLGAKCFTWVSGGYCNGLAHPGKRFTHPFCPKCWERAGEMTRSVLSWSLIGALGGLIRRK